MRLKYFILIFVGIFFTSCGDDRTPIFDFNLETDFLINAGLNSTETYYFPIRNVPTFYTQNIANNGLRADEVTSIVANRASIQPLFIDLDMNFIRRVSIVGYPSGVPDDEREFFYMEFVDINEDGVLDLFSSIAELKDIIASEYIDLEIILNFRTFTPTNIESRLNFSLSVFDE